MKRIVLFISSLQKGGSERVMVNLAEYFHRRRYDVILVTQYRLEEEYPISPEIRRVCSEPDESALQGGRIRNFCVRFGALREIWNAYKPDVILSFLGKNNLMAVATAAFLPSKVAVSVRGEPTMEYEGRLMQMIARFVFRFSDGVVLQTEGARAFFPKAVQKKSVILSNPLNEQFLNKRICEEREDLIVAAGRLDENKNHAMLIHAFAKIAEEYPAVKLVIYGEGALRTALETLVEEKGLGGRISHLQGEDLHADLQHRGDAKLHHGGDGARDPCDRDGLSLRGAISPDRGRCKRAARASRGCLRARRCLPEDI